jgi:hypothetical protein
MQRNKEYSFVSMTVTLRDQVPAEALATFPVIYILLGRGFSKVIISE